MGQAPVGQGDVDSDKEVEARESASAETGLGPFGLGDGDPHVALSLGERLPTFGDRGEGPADSALRGGVGVERHESRVADLAIASALPDGVSAFA